MKQYMGIIVILMLVAGLVAGCNGGSPTPEKTAVLEGSDISTPSDTTSAPTGSDSPTPEGFSETASESTPVVSSDTPIPGETPAENPPAQSIPTSPQQTEPAGSTSSTSTPSAGIIEILVTDAPPGYEITSIEVTVSGVEVHQAVAEQEQAQDQDRDQDGEGDQNNNKNKDKQKSQGNGKGVAGNDESTPTPDDEPSDESDAVVEDNSDDTDGNGSWIQLDIEGTFDLLLVQEVSEVLGTDFLDPGKYTQIRMTVDSIIVEYIDETASGTQTAKAEVPSGKLKFVRPFNIESGQTTSLLFDFIADKSVNFTGSGKVIFKPVIKLQVSEPVPTLNITTNNLPDGTVEEFYSASLEAVEGTTPYAWVWSGSLPGGLTLDGATGIISGTPTVIDDFTFNVQVDDSSGQSDTQSLSISINPAVSPVEIATTSLPAGEEGTAYSATLEAIGGVAPYAWVWSGTLPSGLQLNTSTGVISGTPTVAGDYNFTVQVDDSDSQSDTQDLTINISVPVSPLEISTTSLPDGEEGKGYSATLVATGGTTLYAWTWSGTLPSGLSLDSSGVISGTPAATGTYDVTIQVDDSDSQSDTQALSISIIAPVSPLEITTTSLPNGEEGTGYNTTLAATGGTTPYVWIWSGTLPVGLILDSSGVISGTPAAAGTYDVTIQVDDSSAQSDTTDISVLIEEVT